MSRHRLTVVLSQAQGKNPAKRALEESIAAALIMEPGLDVSIVPLPLRSRRRAHGPAVPGIGPGDMVVLGWMFPRAAFWLLDRDGIKGHLRRKPDQARRRRRRRRGSGASRRQPKGIGSVDVPDRHIYCLDLRDHCDHHEPYVEEVRRIAGECRERREAKLKQWIQGAADAWCSWAGTSARSRPAPPAPVTTLRAGATAGNNRGGAGIR